MKRLLWTLGVAVALAALPSPAAAAPITFVGSSGSLSASVTFDVVAGNLVVTLTNTATSDVLVPADVLTAVFFSLVSDPTLTRGSALLGGSTVFYDADGQPAGGVVGGEWAYTSATTQWGANQVISSSGLGIVGPGDRFPGPDLQSPASPNGVEYGLLSFGDKTATGNAGVLGSGGLIKNSVVFTLSGLSAPCQADVSGCVTNVTFQYGTELTEPSFPGDPGEPVPEPGTLLLLGAGLTGLAARRRRR